MWVHRSMIVSAQYAEIARDLCALLAGAGGAGMFETGLSADGSFPATHYISAGKIESEFAAILPLSGGGGSAEHVAAASGGAATTQQVAALFAAVDVSDEEPHDAIARCGLRMCAAAEV